MMIRRAVGAWFLVAFAVFCVGTLAQPYSLSSSRATTTLGSSATSVWADVTDNGAAFSVSGTIPGSLGTGNVLVMASFSANTATAVTDTAQWRLSDGTNTSNVILRTLSSNTNDQGIATVTWLFTGVTGTQTYHLQHKTLLGNGVRTHHATLVALPLAVSDGGTDLALNAGSDNTGTYEYASASATGENVEKAAGVDLSAAVSLPRAGRVFVAASLNCRPAAGASLHVGEWDLQVDGVTISVARRTMQAAGGNDRGAVTLYGLAEGLAAGTHNATVVVKSVSGQTIVTLNAVVVAVALSFDDDGMGCRRNERRPGGNQRRRGDEVLPLLRRRQQRLPGCQLLQPDHRQQHRTEWPVPAPFRSGRSDILQQRHANAFAVRQQRCRFGRQPWPGHRASGRNVQLQP
jgi:hypothetical protein